VLANIRVDRPGFGLKTADVLAGFAFGLTARFVITLCLDMHKRGQLRPVGGLIDERQIAQRRAGGVPVAAETDAAASSAASGRLSPAMLLLLNRRSTDCFFKYRTSVLKAIT
jgi:hypothetical protein